MWRNKAQSLQMKLPDLQAVKPRYRTGENGRRSEAVWMKDTWWASIAGKELRLTLVLEKRFQGGRMLVMKRDMEVGNW